MITHYIVFYIPYVAIAQLSAHGSCVNVCAVCVCMYVYMLVRLDTVTADIVCCGWAKVQLTD